MREIKGQELIGIEKQKKKVLYVMFICGIAEGLALIFYLFNSIPFNIWLVILFVGLAIVGIAEKIFYSQYQHFQNAPFSIKIDNDIICISKTRYDIKRKREYIQTYEALLESVSFICLKKCLLVQGDFVLMENNDTRKVETVSIYLDEKQVNELFNLIYQIKNGGANE